MNFLNNVECFFLDILTVLRTLSLDTNLTPKKEIKQNFEELLLLLFIFLVGGQGKGSVFENVQKVRGYHFVWNYYSYYYYYYYYPFFEGREFWYTTFLWTPSLRIQNLPRWNTPPCKMSCRLKKLKLHHYKYNSYISLHIFSTLFTIHFQGTD